MNDKGYKNHVFNIFLFVILCTIGGTTYAFQKAGLEEGLPFWTAGIRFLIAGCCMMFYVYATKKFIWIKKHYIQQYFMECFILHCRLELYIGWGNIFQVDYCQFYQQV